MVDVKLSRIIRKIVARILEMICQQTLWPSDVNNSIFPVFSDLASKSLTIRTAALAFVTLGRFCLLSHMFWYVAGFYTRSQPTNAEKLRDGTTMP